MSGAIVQTAAQYLNNGSAGTSWSVSLGSAVGAGNAVVVFFGNLQSGSGGLSVTDDQGNTYTITDFGTSGPGAGYEIGLAYALDIANAPTAIILDAPTLSYPQMVIAEVSGIAALDTAGFQTNTGSTTPSSPSVTTTLPDDFVIGFIASGSGGTTAAAGSGFTQIGPASGSTNFIMEYQTAAAADSVAAGFDFNVSDISGAGIAAFGTGITVISGIAVPLEFSGALVTVTTDAGIQIETLASQAPPPLWIEWLDAVGADATAATGIAAGLQREAPVPLELTGAVSVAGDSLIPIEAPGRLRGDHGAPAENIGSLRGDSDAAAELLSAARADGGLPAELPAAQRRVAAIATEWLGSGTAIITDAMLLLEIRQVPAASLISLETGPGRTRLLTTPGRVRLFRRS